MLEYCSSQPEGHSAMNNTQNFWMWKGTKIRAPTLVTFMTFMFCQKCKTVFLSLLHVHVISYYKSTILKKEVTLMDIISIQVLNNCRQWYLVKYAKYDFLNLLACRSVFPNHLAADFFLFKVKKNEGSVNERFKSWKLSVMF